MNVSILPESRKTPTSGPNALFRFRRVLGEPKGQLKSVRKIRFGAVNWGLCCYIKGRDRPIFLEKKRNETARFLAIFEGRLEDDYARFRAAREVYNLARAPTLNELREAFGDQFEEGFGKDLTKPLDKSDTPDDIFGDLPDLRESMTLPIPTSDQAVTCQGEAPALCALWDATSCVVRCNDCQTVFDIFRMTEFGKGEPGVVQSALGLEFDTSQYVIHPLMSGSIINGLPYWARFEPTSLGLYHSTCNSWTLYIEGEGDRVLQIPDRFLLSMSEYLKLLYSTPKDQK